MKEQIFNLDDIKVNDILYISGTMSSGYCIVKSCIVVSDAEKLTERSEKLQKKMMEIDCRTLSIVEFNSNSGTLTCTLPATTIEGTFISLLDKDYEHTLFRATIEEVEFSLKKKELEEIEKIFEKTSRDVKKVKSEYGNVIQNSLKKLLPETVEA